MLLLLGVALALHILCWWGICRAYANLMLVRELLVSFYLQDHPQASVTEQAHLITAFLAELDRHRPMPNPPVLYRFWVWLVTD